jgi:benzoyl-CoA 2,3-dioxygenase component A
MDTPTSTVIRQHLIDPEICIRCNTCESICPVHAITHDSRNYVVDVDKCKQCMACISPCPTGSIDNWRTMLRASAYSLEAQLGWDSLPAELSSEELATAGVEPDSTPILSEPVQPGLVAEASGEAAFNSSRFGATTPPWSAAHPYTNLYGPKAAGKTITATVAGNVRVTEVGREYDTHHIVLDFGATPFPVLEGQSIAIVPPGVDSDGRAHHPRQ